MEILHSVLCGESIPSWTFPNKLTRQNRSKIPKISENQWLAVETVFMFFFIKETKGPSLEEIAAIFDGDDAVAAIAQKGAETKVKLEGDNVGDMDPEKKNFTVEHNELR